MKSLRRSLLLLVLVCLGCSAQSVPSDLTKKIEREVRAFYNVPSTVKIVVGQLHPSEFPNYDALTITLEDPDQKANPPKTFDFLLARDEKTLIRFVKLDLTKDPYEEAMKKIDTTGRPVRGNKDAKVVVVNYDDFQCPFCSRMHQTLFPELLKEYGDRVRFVYKDFPLEIHPWARHAAVDANCLAAQNNDAYWDFADYIHSNQREVNSAVGQKFQFDALDRIATRMGQQRSVDLTKLQSCIKAQNEDAINASVREGETLGVSATPTLFVNGRELDGALPIAEVRATFDRALQEAGVPVPAHSGSASASNSGSSAK